MVRLEKTHGLKFFRHLDPQEKVRGEGTHFKVPWVTWKLRRWGGRSWGNFILGSRVSLASGFKGHNPL